MFDLGFWEIAIVCVIALVVVGPERLPRLARSVGLWVGRARRMVEEVKEDIDREVRETELQDAAREVREAARDMDNAAGKIARFANEEVGAEESPGLAGDITGTKGGTSAANRGDTKEDDHGHNLGHNPGHDPGRSGQGRKVSDAGGDAKAEGDITSSADSHGKKK